MWYAVTFVSFLTIGYAGDTTLRILGGLLLLVCFTIMFVMIHGRRCILYTGKYSKQRNK